MLSFMLGRSYDRLFHFLGTIFFSRFFLLWIRSALSKINSIIEHHAATAITISMAVTPIKIEGSITRRNRRALPHHIVSSNTRSNIMKITQVLRNEFLSRRHSRWRFSQAAVSSHRADALPSRDTAPHRREKRPNRAAIRAHGYAHESPPAARGHQASIHLCGPTESRANPLAYASRENALRQYGESPPFQPIRHIRDSRYCPARHIPAQAHQARALFPDRKCRPHE